MRRWQRLVSLLVGVFVLATLLSPPVGALAAQPEKAPGGAPKPARDLPAIKSEPPPPPKREIPKGDFSNPPPHPSQKDVVQKARQREQRPPSFDPAKSTPIESETTPSKRNWKNPDGSRTAELSTRPVRFKDPTGAWRDFDLKLEKNAAGVLVPQAAPEAAKLSGNASGAVATVETAAGPISLHHPGASSAEARIEGQNATYPKALDGKDLVLSATTDGYKEKVVLPDASAGPSYLEEFLLPAGVTARNGAEGVEFVDPAGQVLGTLGGGVAYDAALERLGPRVSTPVFARLSETPPKTEAPAGQSVAVVEISVSPQWLSDPQRQFPVTIDPSYYTKRTQANHDAFTPG
ncbi:hypothetical protein BH23ACT12_BH23ACT12_02690 [soil metagenome]